MGSVKETPEFDIPTHCKAGVVVNEGPDFHVEVQEVPVPEPGKLLIGVLPSFDTSGTENPSTEQSAER